MTNKCISQKIIYWLACCVLLGLFLPMTVSAADSPVGVAYRGHIQDLGDYPSDGSWVDSPEIIGTEGQSKRIEGFEIKLTGTVPDGLELRYNVHVQNKGWLYDEENPADWPKDGEYAGTRGESLRIEAVKIVLTDADGQPVSGYTVQYRGHVQNVGDLPADKTQWLTDGDQLGTVGSSLRLEALLVQVVQNETDLAAYTALVAEVEKLKAADFTAQSWAKLQTALKEHLVTAEQSQTEVDTAVKAIQAAYDTLAKKTAPTVYDKVGTFGPATGTATIAGDVKIEADGVILQNLNIAGNLTISEAVGDGNVTLNNVTVEGDTFVRGGGVHSIKINGGQYSRIVMEKTASGAVRIVATGVDGLPVVVTEDAAGETIILEGTFASVTVNAPNMTVTTQGNSTTIGKMTVAEGAAGSTVTVAVGTTVADLVLDGKAAVKGQGTVAKADVKADGVTFDKAPGSYTVEPGVVIPPVFPTPDNGGGGGGGYTPPTPIAVSGVSLNQTTLSVGVSKTAQLEATVLPSNAANKTVTWTSSNDAIVTVDANGQVKGVTEGSATMTVKTTDGNKIATCAVTVTTSFEVTKTAEGIGKITKMYGSNTDIDIPETIDGLTITAIGTDMFKDSGLTSVTIPASVTRIDQAAFENCAQLTTVTFKSGSGLLSIGARTFLGCAKLATITLPDQLTTIEEWAFEGCAKLTTLVLPDSLTTLGALAFSKSGLTAMTIPPLVTKIPELAFYVCADLTTVNLPANLETLGNSAFYDCDKLTDLTIPASVTALGLGAFQKCDGLKTVTFSADSKLTAIPLGMCLECTNLTTITFLGTPQITSIGDAAFQSCNKLANIILPATVTAIGESAFKGCSNLTDITIPVNVSLIGGSAFASPGSAINRTITFLGNAPTLTDSQSIPAGATIKYYSNYTAFDSWTGYTKTPILATPGGLTATLTEGNSGSVDLSWNVVDEAAKYQVYSGSSATTLTANGSLLIAKKTDNQATITGLTPGTTYYFGVKAMDTYGESLLAVTASVRIPYAIPVTGLAIVLQPSSISMGDTALLNAIINPTNASHQKVIWSSGNVAIATVNADTGTISTVSPGTVTITGKTEDGGFTKTCMLTVKPVFETTVSGDGVTITKYNGNETIVEIPPIIGSIPVTGIGAGAFSGKNSLQSVTIPQTVKKIEASAFSGCSNMTTLTLAGSPTLLTIGDNAFLGCQKLNNVSIPSSLESIGSYAFLRCYALNSLDLRSVATIGTNAFNECTALTNLTIPNSVTSIGNQAFAKCAGLKTVSFLGGTNTQTLLGATFWQCTALETVTFAADNKITDLNGATFNECSNLKQVNFSAALSSIGYNAFGSCPSTLVLRFDGDAPSTSTSNIPTGTTFLRYQEAIGFNVAPWTDSGNHLKLRPSLNLTDVSIKTASFSFAPQTGATEVVLQQKPAGAAETAWVPSSVSAPLLDSGSTSATATGLFPGTGYDFRLLISGGDNPEASRAVNLTTAVAVDTVTISSSALELSQNGSGTLTATVSPDAAANKNLNWLSTAPAVATVDSTGLVTAVSVGTATITATAADGSGVSASSTVTVLPYQTSGTLELTITKYLGSDAAVTIPATIGGQPVTAIGEKVFLGNTSLTAITIPASVTSIGVDAFRECINLGSIVIPKKVTSIGATAFYNCPKLGAVTFTADSLLTSIGNNAFKGCEILPTIEIPATVKTIGANAFESCIMLNTVKFAANSALTAISNATFYNCTSLTTIEIPANVTSIGLQAFHTCKIATVTFAANSLLTTIGASAFNVCPLTTIKNIPAGVIINNSNQTMGGNDSPGFIAVYEKTDGNGGAGTYTYTGSTPVWKK